MGDVGLGATTRLAGVIGSPVRHSLSPAIHNAAFAELGLDWAYGAFEVASGDVPAALAGMKAMGFGGLSVTMPHKDAAAAAVDELSPVAAALGAVNCIVPRGDQLVGHNTDGDGLIDALSEIGFDPAGQACVVLGAGGAARAVVLALGAAGAGDVGVVNRSADRAAQAAELAVGVGRVAGAGDVAGAALIVNATPVGMGSAVDQVPVDTSYIEAGQLVVDLIYQPSTTRFLLSAAERGAQTANGLAMLVHQAARAFRLWTGEEPPVAAMSAAATAELARRAAAVTASSTTTA